MTQDDALSKKLGHLSDTAFGQNPCFGIVGEVVSRYSIHLLPEVNVRNGPIKSIPNCWNNQQSGSTGCRSLAGLTSGVFRR